MLQNHIRQKKKPVSYSKSFNSKQVYTHSAKLVFSSTFTRPPKGEENQTLLTSSHMIKAWTPVSSFSPHLGQIGSTWMPLILCNVFLMGTVIWQALQAKFKHLCSAFTFHNFFHKSLGIELDAWGLWWCGIFYSLIIGRFNGINTIIPIRGGPTCWVGGGMI